MNKNLNSLGMNFKKKITLLSLYININITCNSFRRCVPCASKIPGATKIGGDPGPWRGWDGWTSPNRLPMLSCGRIIQNSMSDRTFLFFFWMSAIVIYLKSENLLTSLLSGSQTSQIWKDKMVESILWRWYLWLLLSLVSHICCKTISN